MSRYGPDRDRPRASIDARLRSLHEISMELSRAEDSGALCRKAVELCISQLGFDRIGIWFVDAADPRWMVGTWGTDEEGRLRDESGDRFLRNQGQQRGELYAGAIPFVVVPDDEVLDDRGHAVGRSDKVIAPLWDGTRCVGELVADNLFTGRRIDDEDGEVLAILARTVAHLSVLKRSDAALKEALESKAVLLGELQHRTKNSFGMMRSLISIEAGRTKDPAQADTLIKLRDRVSVLTSLYGQLDASAGPPRIKLDEYLRGIAVDLLDGYGADTRGVSLECRMVPVMVDMKRAVPLGLIVNELITDSLKHAFPEGRRGTIVLALSRDAGVLLSVSDDGIGLPEGFDIRASKGFGITLIDMLRGQIDATLEIGRGPRGSGASFALGFDL
jgi:two-component sensor histidine kinase